MILQENKPDKYDVTPDDNEDSPMNEEKPVFKCNLCERIFQTRSRLRIHERIHTKEESRNLEIQCDTCTQIFNVDQDLRRHKMKKNRKRKKKSSDIHKCNECGYSSSSRAAFKIHIEIVHDNLTPKSPPTKRAKENESNTEMNEVNSQPRDKEL